MGEGYTDGMTQSARAALALLGVLLWAVLLAGCRGDDDTARSASYSIPAGVSSKDADVSLLFMGNSHASLNSLQPLVANMVHAHRSTESVATVEAPGWMFLEERYRDAASMTLFRSQDWSYVVLQAQKYSTSGQYQYSTEEAKALIRVAREQHALPVLFPEWPRLGVDETMRIYDLHVSIAQVEPACVAPIGQAWDLARERHPDLVLHASDGNHSNAAGAFLAALMLAATITGGSPLDVPPLADFGVAAETQAQLRAVAADTVAAWPPRAWCPGDPP